ncbi:hypothetical protein RB597_001013 [Gaeumannomyces tritici]
MKSSRKKARLGEAKRSHPTGLSASCSNTLRECLIVRLCSAAEPERTWSDACAAGMTFQLQIPPQLGLPSWPADLIELLRHLTIACSLGALGVSAAGILALLSAVSYRLYLHPLSGIPGPRLAAISNIWYARQVCAGRLLQVGKEIHDKFGPIVRVGPNEIWLNSEDAHREIYGLGSGFGKSDFYVATALQKPKLDWRLRSHYSDTLDLLSEYDAQRYRQQRRLIGPVYQAANLRKFELAVDQVLDEAVTRINELDGAAIDLKEWMHIITVECLSSIVLSWSPGYLRLGSDGGSSAFSYRGWKRKTIFGLFPLVAILETLSKAVGRAFADLWGLTFKAPKGLRLFFPAVQRKIKTRMRNFDAKKQQKNVHEDLMADLVKLHKERPEFTATYLHRMAITNFGAGHETMCSALTAAMAMLGSSPDVQDRVVRDQQGLADAGNGNWSPAPYTVAAVKEAQRLYPVIGMSLPREVPVGGTHLHGVFLPAGTTVGINPVSLHRNEQIFGPDAHLFNPERWLDPAKSRAMDRCNLTWGGGARTCPGRHLAELILYRTVARLILEFEARFRARK